MRVSEDDVRGFLTWGRNYGEIESYRSIATRGRRWAVSLPAGRIVTASGALPGWTETNLVPVEFVLTGREALAFGYGLAVAGASTETRQSFAAREWGWT